MIPVNRFLPIIGIYNYPRVATPPCYHARHLKRVAIQCHWCNT